MKDRNHLAEVKTTNKVEIITKGVVDIPMLQILSRAMTLVLGVVEVILVQRGAVGVLLVASKELVGQVFDGGRALVEVECGAFGGG